MTKKTEVKADKGAEIVARKKCGIVMPISGCSIYSATHWSNVLAIIKETLRETDFDAELVSDDDSAGIIQHRIVQNLYSNEMVICDVSSRNANVMFELGLRLAFDKPTIIIKDKSTPYPFDVSAIEYLEYPSDLCYNEILVFKRKLKDKLIATYKASKGKEYKSFLSHFGQFKIADIEDKTVSSNEFILRELKSIREELADNNKVSTPSRRVEWIPSFETSYTDIIAQSFNNFIKKENSKELKRILMRPEELIKTFGIYYELTEGFLPSGDTEFDASIKDSIGKNKFILYAQNAIMEELEERGDLPKATITKL